MIQIMEKSKCSGCGACAAICPRKCIHMKRDQEGFLYPVVHQQQCIDCGLCNRRCPMENEEPKSENIPSAIVCCTTDEESRKMSTSGGFFFEIAQYILKNDGVVFGVRFDNEFQPYHCMVNNKEELSLFCRSKYVQSNLGDCFVEVREKLVHDKKVLFSGTPCQIAGLKRFLNREYENLICCDVVCRGVISPLLWKSNIEELAKWKHSPIGYIGFREKINGFHKSRLVYKFNNGKIYAPSTNVERISRFFADALCLRPSCYSCAFKRFDRVSDFTMFDCWNLERLVPNVKDDDLGYTTVLLHSEKAKRYIEKILPSLRCWDVDPLLSEKYDGIMLRNCVKIPKNRNLFFEDMKRMTIRELENKYSPIPLSIQVKEYIKKVLQVLHLY